jgi:hypothetical protein
LAGEWTKSPFGTNRVPYGIVSAILFARPPGGPFMRAHGGYAAWPLD